MLRGCSIGSCRRPKSSALKLCNFFCGHRAARPEWSILWAVGGDRNSIISYRWGSLIDFRYHSVWLFASKLDDTRIPSSVFMTAIDDDDRNSGIFLVTTPYYGSCSLSKVSAYSPGQAHGQPIRADQNRSRSLSGTLLYSASAAAPQPTECCSNAQFRLAI